MIGTAISPSQPRYPRHNPGVAWVTRRHARADRARSRPLAAWTQADPSRGPRDRPGLCRAGGSVLAAWRPAMALVQTWEDQRGKRCATPSRSRIILTTYTIVLLAVVFAVVAILVGARASEQHREIGLLKAVGLTPRQVTTVFALESAALGLVAVVDRLRGRRAPRAAARRAQRRDDARLADDRRPSPWHLARRQLSPCCSCSSPACAGVDPAEHAASACCTRSSPAPRRPRRDRASRERSTARRCPCRSRSASRTSSPDVTGRAGSPARSPSPAHRSSSRCRCRPRSTRGRPAKPATCPTSSRCSSMPSTPCSY